MARIPPRQARKFPTTRWSLVARAGDSKSDTRRQALSELVAAYAAPLRSHLTSRWGVRPEEADDLLQAFLADRIVAENLIGRAEQRRGRFRTFLLTSLDNFALNQFRAARARKRAPDGGLVSADTAVEVEDRSAPRPDEGFDVAWARQVLAQAVDEMCDECERAGRADVWGVFEGRVLRPTLGLDEPTPYVELVSRFGFKSPAKASNILVTANRMFVRLLRTVVGRYEQDPAEVDAELAELRRVLARAGGAGRG